MRTNVGRTGFFADYRASKGPAAVEEASDVIQRPLGYVVARALRPTPVSANAVSAAAMLCAVGSGACFVLHRPGLAAALVFGSAILDSTDGQLARMRKSASLSGRMFDGTADMVGGLSVFLGASWLLVSEHGTSPLRTGLIVVACFVTALTSSLQHSMFDHYKNVWVCMTTAGAAEPDDWQAALARRQEQGRVGPIATIAWATYLSYLAGQRDFACRYDPWTRSRDLPAWDPERAQRYRMQHALVMRVWTLFFGFGTMMMGVALASALGLLELYLLYRLIALNAIFYGWLRSAQRRASLASFGLPDPNDPSAALAEATR